MINQNPIITVRFERSKYQGNLIILITFMIIYCKKLGHQQKCGHITFNHAILLPGLSISNEGGENQYSSYWLVHTMKHGLYQNPCIMGIISNLID